MSKNVIRIQGARTHNLKNVDVSFPMGKITCVVGPSGSGKSSLVFHTLFTESRRRFLNSLPTDIKFFWDIPATCDVDSIAPIMPAWGLAQENPIVGSRPNVADLLGLTERMQLLFFHGAREVCPIHKSDFIQSGGIDDELLSFGEGEERVHAFISKENYQRVFKQFPSRSLIGPGEMPRNFNERDDWWEVGRIKEGVPGKFGHEINTLLKSSPEIRLLLVGGKTGAFLWSSGLGRKKCLQCDRSARLESMGLTILSPTNAWAACKDCGGHGMLLSYDRRKIVKNDQLSAEDGAVHLLNFTKFSSQKKSFLFQMKKSGLDTKTPIGKLPQGKLWSLIEKGNGSFEGTDALFSWLETKKYKKSVRIYLRSFQSEELCLECNGSRVSRELHGLILDSKRGICDYGAIWRNNIQNIYELMQSMKFSGSGDVRSFDKAKSEIGEIALKAAKLGLSHLELRRKARSLSSSEYQRCLLMKYLSYQGSAALFILDEPSIGLAPSEQEVFLQSLKELRDQGNTIVMIDHSSYLQERVDHLIEIGPEAGERGGHILYAGPPKKSRSKRKGQNLSALGIKAKGEIVAKNLEHMGIGPFSFNIPLSRVTLVQGESGTGKTSIMIKAFANMLSRQLHAESLFPEVEPCGKVNVPSTLSEVHLFDTTMNRYSSRSSVGTFLDLAGPFRKHFTGLEISKQLGLSDGHFSSNSELGRCPTCEGTGKVSVDMQFLEELEFTCSDCKGMKLRPYLASISDGEMTVYQALKMPLSDVFKRIKNTPKTRRTLEYLERLNLGHLCLERQLKGLSGGEKLRVKLIAQLLKKMQNALLVFENVSYGLSEAELVGLWDIFSGLIKLGHTLVIIDNNPFWEQVSDKVLIFKRNKDQSISLVSGN
jgi:excinuclease ABC subunit A